MRSRSAGMSSLWLVCLRAAHARCERRCPVQCSCSIPSECRPSSCAEPIAAQAGRQPELYPVVGLACLITGRARWRGQRIRTPRAVLPGALTTHRLSYGPVLADCSERRDAHVARNWRATHRATIKKPYALHFMQGTDPSMIVPPAPARRFSCIPAVSVCPIPCHPRRTAVIRSGIGKSRLRALMDAGLPRTCGYLAHPKQCTGRIPASKHRKDMLRPDEREFHDSSPLVGAPSLIVRPPARTDVCARLSPARRPRYRQLQNPTPTPAHELREFAELPLQPPCTPGTRRGPAFAHPAE
ncbi:hypothetical protein BD413DRAFT_89464 [Trametes elegans]|nr:hypothetical protein BD413DRAFT_89464 [Trametes elegans]